MFFAFLGIVVLMFGRYVGWFVSRAFLYTAPKPIAVILCIAWGVCIAFLMRILINYCEPNVYARRIMGYSLGAYVAVPNFGLIDETTITDDAQGRHSMISNVPFDVYIAASIALVFCMSK